MRSGSWLNRRIGITAHISINPADLISRGVSPEKLIKNKLWWQDPEFLCYPKDMWFDISEKRVPSESSKSEIESEIRIHALFTVIENVINLTTVVDVNRFNDFYRLLRVTAWVLRFVYNLKRILNNSLPVFTELTIDEIRECEKMWIKENQKVFHDKKYDNLKNILNVVLVNDLICCKGRIENANVPDEKKKPILLSHDYLAELIVLLLFSIFIQDVNISDKICFTNVSCCLKILKWCNKNIKILEYIYIYIYIYIY